MPLDKFTLDDACKLWHSIENESEWFPAFLHCGPFDYRLEAFPLKTKSGVHHLWIPVEWKFALRFLNHVIYCVWHASLDQRLSDKFRGHLIREGKYAEHLRSGFFDEVLEYWYRPGTKLPMNEEPTRQNYPLHSCYLTIFLVIWFNRVSLGPANQNSAVELAGWNLDPTTFDWEKWAMKNSVNTALYGALPPVSTEEFKRLLEENRLARISNTPSVEIDSSSWSRFASILAMIRRRRHSAIPTVPSRRSCTTETDTDESELLLSSASPGPKKKCRLVI